MAQTRRQAVLEALHGNVPEFIPFATFSGGAWSALARGDAGRQAAGLPYSAFAGNAGAIADVFSSGARAVKSDIVFTGSGMGNYLVRAYGAELLDRGSDSPSVQYPIINSIEDIARLDPATMEKDQVVQSIREACLLLTDEMGEEAAVTFNSWAPFTLAGQFCGVDRLMLACLEEPEFAAPLVGACTRLVLAYAAPVLATNRVPVVSLSDPTASGNLISRRIYQQYAMPGTREVAALASQHGAATMLHVCGRTQDRLDLMVQTAATGLSLDTVVDLAEARQKVGDQICLVGNVDPVALIERGTPEQVYEAAKQAIAAAAGGPFILAPGCDIPLGAPLENILAMVRAAREA